jgi:Zn-dependent protease with chaperone function
MVYAAVCEFRCAARGIRGPRVPTAVIRLARSSSSLLKQPRAGDAFARLLSGGPAGYAFPRLFGRLFLLRIARNAELEADRLALDYNYASGYDPAQFVRQNAFSGAQQEGFFARLLDDTRRRKPELSGQKKQFVIMPAERLHSGHPSSRSQRSRCNESRQPDASPGPGKTRGP